MLFISQAIDVVNTRKRLPFKDNVFALVVSQAVFEHLEDPHESAREILRVLKPGGICLIDTAFMQPLHGDPHHYFNMTSSGLKQVMAGFEIIDFPKQPHQTASFSLVMQFDHVLPTMKEGLWKNRLAQFLSDLRADMKGFDEALNRVGNQRLAAGVAVLARKPL